MADVAALATAVAVIAVVLLLVQALTTPTTAAVAADGVVSANTVVTDITNATPSYVDAAVSVAFAAAALTEVAVITVCVGAVAAAAVGAQSAVGKDAPTVSHVRPDLLCGVLPVTTADIAVEVDFAVFVAVSAVVTAASVLSVLRNVTAEGFLIQFCLRCFSVKECILFF